MHYDDAITLAEKLSPYVGRSEATLSNKIVGHARFFQRLRAGSGCSVKTYNKVLDWFSVNWPEGLDWPEHIERPKSKRKGVV